MLSVAFLTGFAIGSAAQIPPPRTVNDLVIGTAEEYTTAGPARVCMDNLMITARSGESVSLNYSGIHGGKLRLNRQNSWIDVSLSEIFRQPANRGPVILRHAADYVADASDETRLRYGLYGRSDFYDDLRLLALSEGPSFVGDERDDSVLRRIELRRLDSPPCDVTYDFGPYDGPTQKAPALIRDTAIA